MIRVVFVHLLLFLLPFIGYGLWLYLYHKTYTAQSWREGPIIWLSISGLAMVIISLIFFANIEQSGEEKLYRPAEIRDGKFIPGGYQ